MSKGKLVWIAEHPTEPESKEVRFKEPYTEGEHVYGGEDGYSPYVKWKQYVLIEVE